MNLLETKTWIPGQAGNDHLDHTVISASACGVACATYYLYGSAQPLDFLDLARNCSFLIWKLR